MIVTGKGGAGIPFLSHLFREKEVGFVAAIDENSLSSALSRGELPQNL